MIKTVISDGTESRVDGLGGKNTVIVNFGSAELYASAYPGIVPDGDSVAAIPAGGAVNLRDTYGTVYLLGTGKVQLMGTDYKTVNVGLTIGGSGGDTPGGDTMPVMYGITGYFTPETLNVENGLWRNAVANAPDIALTNAESFNGHLHLPADGFGELESDVPRTLYAIFKTTKPSAGKYGSLISKGFAGDYSVDGAGFDFESMPEGGIKLSGFNTVSPVIMGGDCENWHLYSATYLNAETVAGYYDGADMGSNATFSNTQGFSGMVYLNNQNIHGERYSTPYPSDFIFIAVGTAKHTPEQIARNSAWLMKKYLGGA